MDQSLVITIRIIRTQLFCLPIIILNLLFSTWNKWYSWFRLEFLFSYIPQTYIACLLTKHKNITVYAGKNVLNCKWFWYTRKIRLVSVNLNIKGKVPILEALFSILLNLYWKSNQGYNYRPKQIIFNTTRYMFHAKTIICQLAVDHILKLTK